MPARFGRVQQDVRGDLARHEQCVLGNRAGYQSSGGSQGHPPPQPVARFSDGMGIPGEPAEVSMGLGPVPADIEYIGAHRDTLFQAFRPS
ncbi:hypothetical protein GCM10007147_38440 [Nocardiopsis kunsanensis]|uniref:Uncharacterized protein n=1 Tax=Nocardiopsis kunsanensis TaxID=141693 RepID=A0A918XIN6_9ACTN|nr:hypothetical protein GCM10007147_38440 [Nocardiopsis kunsanensis]